MIVGRTTDGWPLVPGVNVDAVNVAAGMEFAAAIGFASAEDQMVVQYALLRWRKGEEEGADRTWVSYFPRNFMAWRMIIAHAIASAS